jgi:hypothetical protein
MTRIGGVRHNRGVIDPRDYVARERDGSKETTKGLPQDGEACDRGSGSIAGDYLLCAEGGPTQIGGVSAKSN